MAEKLTALAAYLEEFNVLSVTVRILLATLCGGVLGIERGKANQAAGMRTHILVCLGATLIMLTAGTMFIQTERADFTAEEKSSVRMDLLFSGKSVLLYTSSYRKSLFEKISRGLFAF